VSGLPSALLVAACRLALLPYPRAFRQRHGRQIAVALRDAARREAAGHGAGAAVRRTLVDLCDVAAAGFAERFGGSRRALRSHPAGSAASAAALPTWPDARSPGVIERMREIPSQLRLACRTLWRQPTFTAMCVLTLAIAIGANVVIFSIVKRVLLDPLPYPDAGRLVWINTEHDEIGFELVSAADLADWRSSVSEIAEMAGYMYWSYTFTEGDEPLDVPSMRVTPELFDVLGVAAQLGRTFRASDGVAGGEPVAVVSHWFWQDELGGDEGILGRRLVLDGAPHTVVGVMPEAFAFPPDARNGFWTAVAYDPEAAAQRRAVRTHMVIGRLADVATIGAAERELDALAAALGEEYPDTNGAYGTRVRPAHEMLVVGATGADAIWALFAGVGLLLLIACTNVTNLMLARLASRDREMSVRAALGAGRGHLVRQFMSETLVLAAIGGAAGTLLAVGGIGWVRTLPHLPLARLQELQLDGGVLLFALGLTLAVGIVFGLLPARRATRWALGDSLRHSGATGTGGARTLDALVVAEVALALVLLIGAALLARTFAELMAIDLGFGRDNLLAANVYIPDTLYPEDHQQVAFFDDVIERVEGIPGVVSAAAVTALPMDQAGIDFSLDYVVVGRDEADGTPPEAQYRVATPGYFETMAIPLMRGRGFEPRDRVDAPRVMLINETLARRAFADLDPIGEQLRIPIGGPHEIIGVVRDVRHYGLGREPLPEMYIPMQQNPFSGMVVVVRTEGAPAAFAEGIKRKVLEVDPRQPIYAFNTMDELISQNVAFPRLNMVLSMVFGGVALLLATVGIYGVMAYAVAQRTREIGVRMALGAGRRDALRAVLRRGLSRTLLGLTLGVAGALALTRLLQSQLFGIAAHDPVVFAGVPLLFLLIALAASWVPGRRAARVDPLVALRQDIDG
jgi:putative ABC transport system permease protein